MQLNTFTPNPSENAVTKIVYQVKSAIPGRIRWHIRGLKDSRIQQMLKNFFESLNGVTDIRINAMAESVIVTFSEQKLSATDLQEKFAQSITDISSPHPSVLPLQETLETEEKAKPIQQKINEAKRKPKNSIPQSKITQDTIALKSSSSPKQPPEKNRFPKKN